MLTVAIDTFLNTSDGDSHPVGLNGLDDVAMRFVRVMKAMWIPLFVVDGAWCPRNSCGRVPCTKKKRRCCSS